MKYATYFLLVALLALNACTMTLPYAARQQQAYNLLATRPDSMGRPLNGYVAEATQGLSLDRMVSAASAYTLLNQPAQDVTTSPSLALAPQVLRQERDLFVQHLDTRQRRNAKASRSAKRGYHVLSVAGIATSLVGGFLGLSASSASNQRLTGATGIVGGGLSASLSLFKFGPTKQKYETCERFLTNAADEFRYTWTDAVLMAGLTPVQFAQYQQERQSVIQRLSESGCK